MIVAADQAATADNFWIRAIAQSSCSNNQNPTAIRGIITYADTITTPTTSAYTYSDECVDEPYASLVPFLSKTAGDATYTEEETVSVGRNSDNLFRWSLNETSYLVEWDAPVSKNSSAQFAAFTNMINVDSPRGPHRQRNFVVRYLECYPPPQCRRMGSSPHRD